MFKKCDFNNKKSSKNASPLKGSISPKMLVTCKIATNNVNIGWKFFLGEFLHFILFLPSPHFSKLPS